MDLIRQCLISKPSRCSKQKVSDINCCHAAIFFVDNLDTTNQHELMVEGSIKYGLHITAIQGVFAKNNSCGTHPLVGDVGPADNMLTMGSVADFVNSVVPSPEDVDVITFLEKNVYEER